MWFWGFCFVWDFLQSWLLEREVGLQTALPSLDTSAEFRDAAGWDSRRNRWVSGIAPGMQSHSLARPPSPLLSSPPTMINHCLKRRWDARSWHPVQALSGSWRGDRAGGCGSPGAGHLSTPARGTGAGHGAEGLQVCPGAVSERFCSSSDSILCLLLAKASLLWGWAAGSLVPHPWIPGQMFFPLSGLEFAKQCKKSRTESLQPACLSASACSSRGVAQSYVSLFLSPPFQCY